MTAALSLFDCAQIAEEVQCNLDRVAAVITLLANRENYADAALELIEENVLDLARKLEPVAAALLAMEGATCDVSGADTRPSDDVIRPIRPQSETYGIWLRRQLEGLQKGGA
jgi:hypothetical protein